MTSQPPLTCRGRTECMPSGMLEKSLPFCLLGKVTLPQPGSRASHLCPQSPPPTPSGHLPHHCNGWLLSASSTGLGSRGRGLASFLLPCPEHRGEPRSWRLATHMPLLFEHLDQRRECIIFFSQITLPTAGEGKNKSPQRAQRMRDMKPEGPGRPRGDSTG